MFLFWVRAACELRLVNYCSKHVFQFLSDMSFCMYLHAQPEHYGSYTCMTAPLLEKLLLWFRVAWEIQLESYGPQTCIPVVFWYNIVYILQALAEKCGHLQLYYTPNNSTTTQNDSSCAKSSKAVTISKIWSSTYIATWYEPHMTNKLIMTILHTKQQLHILPMVHHFIRTAWASLHHDLWAAAYNIYLHVGVFF